MIDDYFGTPRIGKFLLDGFKFVPNYLLQALITIQDIE